MCIHASREADIPCAGDLSRAVTGIESSLPAHVVFDLSGLTFMDSSGIKALVEALGRRAAFAGVGIGAIVVVSLLGVSGACSRAATVRHAWSAGRQPTAAPRLRLVAILGEGVGREQHGGHLLLGRLSSS